MKWSGRAIALIVSTGLALIVPLIPALIELKRTGGDVEFMIMIWLNVAIAAVVAVIFLGIPGLLLLDRLRVTNIIPFLALGAAIGLMTFGFYVLSGFVYQDPMILSATGAFGGLVYWTIARFLDRRAAVLESRRT